MVPEVKNECKIGVKLNGSSYLEAAIELVLSAGSTTGWSTLIGSVVVVEVVVVSKFSLV